MTTDTSTLTGITGYVAGTWSIDPVHSEVGFTARHEAGRPSPWRVSDAPGDFIDGQLRAIVGVELTIATVEAKEKLSQNRDAGDRAGALDGLRHEPGQGPAAIAELMASLPPPRR